MYNDFESSYEHLLNKSNMTTLYNTRCKHLLLEVFKSLNGLNPSYIQELFALKQTKYNLRKTALVKSHIRTQTYGKNSISHEGTILWSLLDSEFIA